MIKIAMIFLVVQLADTTWLNDFREALATAEREDRLVLLYFSGSDWCGPCIQLKKEVFDADKFKVVAENNLVLVRADFPRLKKNKLPDQLTTHNMELAEKYNTSGKFPLVVLLDAEGKVIHQWDGYVAGSGDEYLKELERTISRDK